MSGTAVMERIAEGSPRKRARVAGLFYLLTTALGVSGLVLSGRIVVSGDSAATAANIAAKESLFRLAYAADLVAGVCYVVVAVLFYQLFRPVNRSLSLLATLFSVMGCTVAAFGGVFHLAPTVVLGGARSPSVFSGDELQVLAMLLFGLRSQVAGVAFVFFGLYCLLIGYLIFRSTFLPRILGSLMAIAGLCWLTGSVTGFLSPPLASLLRPYLLAGGIGEAALTVWLLAKGVDEQRWNDQAGGAGKPPELRAVRA